MDERHVSGMKGNLLVYWAELKMRKPELKPMWVIGLGFGIVVLLMVSLIAFSLLKFRGIDTHIQKMVDEYNGHGTLTAIMYKSSRERSLLLHKIVSEPDAFLQGGYVLQYREYGAKLTMARQEFMHLPLNAEETILLEKQRQATSRTVALEEKVIELALAGKRNEARMLLNEALPAQDGVLETLTELNYHQNREVAENATEAQAHGNQAMLFMLAGGGAVAALSLLIALYVHRSIRDLIQKQLSITYELEESARELRFQKLAVDEHAIVSVADGAGKIIYANQKFSDISQYSRNELVGQDHHIFNSGYHPKTFFAELWSTVLAGKIWHGLVCNRKKDGSLYWVETTIVPFLDEAGKPYQFVSIRTDITPVKEAEILLSNSKETLERMVAEQTEEIREREEIFRSITSTAQDAIVMVDDSGNVTYWNIAADKILGYSADEAMGKKLHDLIMPEKYRGQYEAGFSLFTKSGNGGSGMHVGRTTELIAVRKDGSEVPVEVSLSAANLKGRWHGIGILRDITERKKTERLLKELATTDSLTLLANRRKFEEALAAEAERAKRYDTALSVMLIDIDHFKEVNDTFGHQAGDEVLIKFAGVITGVIRATDMAARWGGEEFALLAPQTGEADAYRLAEKVRQAVEQYPFLEGKQVTCSIGVSTLLLDEPIDAFIERADKALYAAKNQGRNQVKTA